MDLLADPVAFERNLDQNDVRDLIGQNIGNIAETELLDHHRIFQLKSHVAFRIKKAVDKKSLFMGNFVIRRKIGGQSAREQILGKTAIGGRQHQFQTVVLLIAQMVNRLQLKKFVLFNPANFRRMLPHSLIQSFVIEVENKRNGILLEFFAFGHILGGVFLNLFQHSAGTMPAFFQLLQTTVNQSYDMFRRNGFFIQTVSQLVSVGFRVDAPILNRPYHFAVPAVIKF